MFFHYQLYVVFQHIKKSMQPHNVIASILNYDSFDLLLTMNLVNSPNASSTIPTNNPL